MRPSSPDFIGPEKNIPVVRQSIVLQGMAKLEISSATYVCKRLAILWQNFISMSDMSWQRSTKVAVAKSEKRQGQLFQTSELREDQKDFYFRSGSRA